MEGQLRKYPRVIEVMVPGVTLAGNPLDDPTERRVPVYLPPSYNDNKRFPVIYLLAGFASTGAKLFELQFRTTKRAGNSGIPDSSRQDAGNNYCHARLHDPLWRFTIREFTSYRQLRNLSY